MEKPLDQFDFEDFWPDASREGEVVGRFYSVMEAQLAASRLRAEQIPCFLANEHTNTIMPELVDYVRLHVRPADAEEARLVLVEMNPDWVIDSSAFGVQKKNTGIPAATVFILTILFVIFLLAVWGAFFG